MTDTNTSTRKLYPRGSKGKKHLLMVIDNHVFSSHREDYAGTEDVGGDQCTVEFNPRADVPTAHVTYADGTTEQMVFVELRGDGKPRADKMPAHLAGKTVQQLIEEHAVSGLDSLRGDTKVEHLWRFLGDAARDELHGIAAS